MTTWRAAWVIAIKDLRIEWRHRTAFATAAVFATLVLMVFVFARDEGSVSLLDIAPSVLWIMLALTCVVTLNRGFLLEREHSAFDATRLAPIPPMAVFWGKWIANTALVMAVEVIAVPLWVLFFNIPPGVHLLLLVPVVILATIGFTAPGTLFAALAVRTRFADLLLPVLLLPFVVPPLFFASRATIRIVADVATADVFSWLRLLALYDIAFLVLAALLFPAVMDQ